MSTIDDSPNADLGARVISGLGWLVTQFVIAALLWFQTGAPLDGGTLTWLALLALPGAWVGALAALGRIANLPAWLLPRRHLTPAVLLAALAWGTAMIPAVGVLPTGNESLKLLAVAVLAAALAGLWRAPWRSIGAALVLLLAPMLAAVAFGAGDAVGTAVAVLTAALTAGIAARLPADGETIVASGPSERDLARIHAEAKFQADRANQELRAELERHKNIEAELKAAKQAAEAASMAKGEFLATMSHEIRTPLNGIIPLLEILRDTKLDPEQREYLNTSLGSARQLLRIIDDILDYSKLEANKLELEQIGLNLKELVDSVVRLMEKPAEAKGLRISVQIDPQVRLAVRGDPVRLRQVLTNLVSNAVKFTEKGGIQIQISKKGETRTHTELTFAVRDTGIGIAPEVADKLFKPFSQADASTTRIHGGTGLGLVICKRLVDLMNGKIGVKSEPGRGSVFWFTVPMLKAIGDMPAQRRDLSGTRTLLISADQRFLQRAQAFLGGWAMSHNTAGNTADALSKLKSAATLGENWTYDVAILDLGSMRASGIGFVRSLGRDAQLAALKLVIVQGEEILPADLIEPRRAVLLGRNFGESDLMGALNRLLDVGEESSRPLSLLEEAKRIGAEPDLDRGPAASPPEATSGPISGRVLLVEDNPVNRQVAQRLVGLLGLEIDIAENGQEAVEKMRQGPYSVVLMDCQMPVMDGYTATRTRRQQEAEQGLPRLTIIAMTANAMAGDREKCLAAGMDDYMSKPLNRGVLEETLRKWLRTAARPASVSAGTAAPAPAPAAGPSPVARAAVAARAVEPAPPPTAAASAPVRAPAPSPAATPRAAPSVPQPSEPAPPAPTAGPAIDREVFDELVEVMGTEFIALVDVYLEDTPRNLKRLSDAAARGDIEGMIAPAHSLKSTSANLGAMRLSQLAKAIEQGGRQQQLDQPERRVRELEVEYQRVAEDLRRILATSGPH